MNLKLERSRGPLYFYKSCLPSASFFAEPLCPAEDQIEQEEERSRRRRRLEIRRTPDRQVSEPRLPCEVDVAARGKGPPVVLTMG
jgi:hypothetical protein